MRRNERFVSWLEAQMNERNLSNRELGKLVSIANSTISHWMNGKTDPNDANIRALARYFKVKRAFLYTLLDRIEPIESTELDETEMRIVATYRSLPNEDEKQRFLKLAEAFSGYQAENESEEDHPLPSQG